MNEMTHVTHGSIFEIQAGICRTLSNPIRLEIIHLLSIQPLCVGEIVQATGQSESVISRHLGLLRSNNLAIGERHGQEIIYHIANPKIITICSLMREVLVEQASHQSELVQGLSDEYSTGFDH
jgi:DNA-binding transcriptional ArsR family regulator